MVAETAQRYSALEAQAQKIMGVFTRAGYEYVSPAIIQPAGVFLDVIGEGLRARTYVFQDPEGDELCLRPDLTVPTCRLHLERHPGGDVRARYCYNGPIFRFQPGGGDATHPREFRQAGLENFAQSDRPRAEAEVVVTVVEALKAAGLERFKLRIGDLGIFNALIEALDMPDRWRQRLRHAFWRPETFHQELARLSGAVKDETAARPLAKDLIARLDPERTRESEVEVARYLEAAGIELIGTRTLPEITESLLVAAADARAKPLPADTAALIESYVGVKAPCKAAGARLRDIMSEKGVDLSDAFDVFKRRLELLEDEGIDVTHAEFSAEFGRNLEYYTGFVFEIIAPELGAQSPVAGGGRYDHLLMECGAPHDVSAVGSAIHTERLLQAVESTAS